MTTTPRPPARRVGGALAALAALAVLAFTASPAGGCVHDLTRLGWPVGDVLEVCL